MTLAGQRNICSFISSKGHLVLPSPDGSPVKACVCVRVTFILLTLCKHFYTAIITFKLSPCQVLLGSKCRKGRKNDHYEILNKTPTVRTQACSYNHCCIGKAIRISYSECAFVALGIQPAMRMRHTGLYNIFPRYLIKDMLFERKLLNIKCMVFSPLQILSETFSF